MHELREIHPVQTNRRVTEACLDKSRTEMGFLFNILRGTDNMESKAPHRGQGTLAGEHGEGQFKRAGLAAAPLFCQELSAEDIASSAGLRRRARSESNRWRCPSATMHY